MSDEKESAPSLERRSRKVAVALATLLGSIAEGLFVLQFLISLALGMLAGALAPWVGPLAPDAHGMLWIVARVALSMLGLAVGMVLGLAVGCCVALCLLPLVALLELPQSLLDLPSMFDSSGPRQRTSLRRDVRTALGLGKGWSGRWWDGGP